MNSLERRIIDLSYRHKLSHIGSCLNAVNILAGIYDIKRDKDIVVLGQGHASLALYVVLESLGLCDSEDMIHKHGTHAHRDPDMGIHVSGGSLGQAETVAVGLAMADPSRNVYLVTSDGSAMEGSVYEAMRIARKHCPNLVAYVLFNGTGAYTPIDREDLPTGMNVIEVGQQLPEYLKGVPGHYLVLSEEQHAELMAA